MSIALKMKNCKAVTNGLSLSSKVAYGCGDAACNVVWGAMSAWLMYYYTNVAHVSALSIGTIMLLSRIIDGFTDIIMGIIVDKTKSKHGKARPWLLRMAIPFAIATVAMFSVPESDNTIKLIYIFVTYNLVNTFYTGINVPYGALSSLMTQDQYERSLLNIYRIVFAQIANFIVASMTMPLIQALGGTRYSWSLAYAIFTAVAVGLFVINFIGTKEVVGEDASKREDVPVKVGLKALITNKYWIIVTVLGAFTSIFNALMISVNTYYSEYILNDVNIASILNSAYMVPMVITLLCIAPLVKRIGKRYTNVLGWIVILVSYLVLLINPSNTMLVIGTSLLRGAGFACVMGVQFAFIADTIEYGQWKSNVRTEGLIFSAQSFGGKFGAGLGSALVGGVLAMGAYDGALSVQPDTALMAIKVLYLILPIVVALIQLLLMIPYKLDKEYPQIIKDLKERELRREL